MRLSHSLKYVLKGHLEDRLQDRDEGSFWQCAASPPLLPAIQLCPRIAQLTQQNKSYAATQLTLLRRQLMEYLWLFG